MTEDPDDDHDPILEAAVDLVRFALQTTNQPIAVDHETYRSDYDKSGQELSSLIRYVEGMALPLPWLRWPRRVAHPRPGLPA